MTLIVSFHWYDYVIFVSTLVISASIGIYFAYYGRKQNTINEYLMGSKQMKMLPVALSVTVSHFSAMTLTSVPADVYKYGAYYLFTCLSMILVAIVTIFVYLPIFFDLQVTSIYEYLEKRFDRKTKLLASCLYVARDIISNTVMIYTSSLALSTIMGFNLNVVCFGTYLICLFYTAIGGLRTVIWTDLFQLLIVTGSLICLIVGGVLNEGGLVPIWNTVIEGGRLDIFDLDLNPARRDSFWIYTIGFTTQFVSYISLHQAGMQKFLTIKSYRDCIWSVIYCAISMCIVSIFCVSVGLLMYARYSQCDLLLSKKITRHDQMVAYYVADITKGIPGISGLFAATMGCATLSSVSCALNAVAGVIYKDFVSPFLSRNISDKKATNTIKLIVTICGFICMSLVMVIQHVKEIFPFAISMIAMGSGPSLGMFTLGVFFPQANIKGTFFGTILGSIGIATIVIPKNYYQFRQSFIYPSKPISTTSCGNNFTSTRNFTTPIRKNIQTPTIPFPFRISHFHICIIGAVLTVALGLIISRITTKDETKVDKILLSPFVRHLSSKKSAKEERVLENLLEEKDDS